MYQKSRGKKGGNRLVEKVGGRERGRELELQPDIDGDSFSFTRIRFKLIM